jgi:hypothetical protein
MHQGREEGGMDVCCRVFLRPLRALVIFLAREIAVFRVTFHVLWRQLSLLPYFTFQYVFYLRFYRYVVA